MTASVATRVLDGLDPSLLLPVPRSADDVRVHRLADGLWSLRLPLPYVTPRSVNAYVVRGRDGWILVDPGIDTPDCRWPSLEHALSLAGVDPRSVATVFVTHWHPDHAGLAAEAARQTGAEIVAGRGPAEAWDRLRHPGRPLEERRALAASHGVPDELLDRFVVDKIGDDHFHELPALDRALDPGEALQTPDGEWRAVPLGGHALSQYGLFHPGRRWLISGDVSYAGVPPYLEWGFAIDPLAEHLAALTLAERLRPVLMLPGHGPPDHETATRLAASRAATLELAKDVMTALDQGATTAYGVTVALTPRTRNPDRRQSLLCTCLAVLEHAAVEGSVTSERDPDGVRRFALASGLRLDRHQPRTYHDGPAEPTAW